MSKAMHQKLYLKLYGLRRLIFFFNADSFFFPLSLPQWVFEIVLNH